MIEDGNLQHQYTNNTHSVGLSPQELYRLIDRHLSEKFNANFCG
jgi:hypothetical protein